MFWPLLAHASGTSWSESKEISIGPRDVKNLCQCQTRLTEQNGCYERDLCYDTYVKYCSIVERDDGTKYFNGCIEIVLCFIKNAYMMVILYVDINIKPESCRDRLLRFRPLLPLHKR